MIDLRSDARQRFDPEPETFAELRAPVFAFRGLQQEVLVGLDAPNVLRLKDFLEAVKHPELKDTSRCTQQGGHGCPYCRDRTALQSAFEHGARLVRLVPLR